MNCFVVPSARLELAGVIAIETSVAAETVSVVDPDTLPTVAWIVVDPAAAEVARPIEPEVSLMVATPVLAEFQVAEAVRL